MKLSRLRGGERLVLVSAVGLAVVLALDWYRLATPDARLGAHESGIRALGWLADLVLVAAVLIGLALVVTTVAHGTATAWPVVLSVFTALFGALAVLVVALRLIFQPTLGVDAPASEVDVLIPAWLGLITSAGIAVGGWLTMSDERTDSAEALEQTEDVLRVRGAPRPAPPQVAEPS